MHRRRLLLLAPAAMATGLARAADPSPPPELAQALPSSRLRGEGRMTFLALHIYDIRLWSPQPVDASNWASSPLALAITYARTLYGDSIAERSIDEMRRQGEIDAATSARWLDEMKRLFPDVGDGTRLTGVLRPGIGAAFFHDGQPRGEVRDPAFARRFFGIWLAPETSEPALRTRLLGGAK